MFLLSLWSSLILFLARRRAREIAPYATAVLLGFAAFFTSLAAFCANPFYTSANPPAEGAGLDPLLLHPSMMIHPPMLYSGYTLLTIPFAFAIGALITGRLGAEWISLTRRFALAAWLFLGIGILLGARWSYTELGWGGYWAWDPVENAALMPWLCITAFIHSIMIQEKRGMLKMWNVSLVLAAGTLSILGTFLVRSGILDSIHAFGASTLGVPFVILLAVMVLGSIGLIVWRRDLLRSDARLESLLSREAVFLFQNLVLVGMVFVIFWITFFPLISRGADRDQGVGRAAGVPAVHRSAGADPRAAVGDRADHRVAAGDGREPAPELRDSGRRGPGDVLRAAVLAGRPELAAVRADHVRARGVRADLGRPGARGAASSRAGR